MKKLLCCFSCLLLSLQAFAQSGIIDEALYQQLNDPQRQEEYFRVRILLADQVDLAALSQTLDQTRADRDTRIRTVVKALMDKAAATQTPLLETLSSLSKLHRDDIKFYEAYWIANLVVTDARPAVILYLAQSVPGIALIDPDLDLEFKNDPVLEEPGHFSPNAVNGSEIGLRVIKSDSLWKKGYTGRGRLGMIIDSGASGNHPALRSRWRGNFVPVSHAWLGPSGSVFPNECGGDHGSHVMGIILGLDRATNDTIGSAVNAQWIAASGISCSGGPSTTASFQWGLNPDGDSSTTADVPDVINNSWGGSTGGTSQCNGSYVPVFNALEAAGIAVVFSAGNSGPNVSTITSPKNINTNEVNVFCTGNINGNNSSFPIASSSSRGPSICSNPESGLQIKPEVVAPGSSVRSSIGASSYGTKTGTSMAAPHVSGGVLLLKEAFPNAPGSDILRAIYVTAIDMGTAGEDNTYGNGRVDLNAAFNHLALTYNPTPPQGGAYNVKAESTTATNMALCGDSLATAVTVRNIGDSVITSIQLDVAINNSSVLQYNWTGSLASNASTSIQLPSMWVPAAATNNSLSIRVKLDTNLAELDTFDNRILTSFQVRVNAPTPFREQFEASNINTTPFYVRNPDNGIGWVNGSATGQPGSFRSAMMNCYNYSSRDQFDYLETPNLQLPDTGQATLRFYLAYAQNPGNSDSLFVQLSTDCGQSFSAPVYANGGANMGTTTARNTPFTPVTDSDWRRIDIPLNSYIGQGRVIVRFAVKNDFGNNIYLDRLSITSNSSKPVADFSYDLPSGCAPLNVDFDDVSLFAGTRSWQLNGTPAGTANPNTLSLTAGNHTVSLIASNSFGSDTLTYSVNVPSSPIVDFNVLIDTVRQGQQINLVNLSQFATSFLWEFGDGTVSNAFGPSKIYADTGWYDISLTGITNGCAVRLDKLRAVYVQGATVSVHDLGVSGFRIYPNPAKDQLTIDADEPLLQGIQLVDLLGRKQLDVAPTSASSIHISLETLKPGMYLIHLPTENGVLIRKLIKE